MSKALTKIRLARQIAHDKRFGLTVKKAEDLVETVTNLIALHLLEEDGPVTIRGFGTFKLRFRKAFIGWHPRTGEGLRVAPAVSLAFKPSPELVANLNTTRRMFR
jgi:nucleoid DNA-binding protein